MTEKKIDTVKFFRWLFRIIIKYFYFSLHFFFRKKERTKEKCFTAGTRAALSASLEQPAADRESFYFLNILTEVRIL